MHENPFESAASVADPAPAMAPRPASRLPHAMAAAVALACTLVGMLGWVYGYLSLREEDPAFIPPLWQTLVNIFSDMLLGALAGFLLTRFWCERHAWAGQRQPWRLLAATLIGSVVASVLATLLAFSLWNHFLTGVDALREQYDVYWMVMVGGRLVSLLSWLFGVPLLVLLVLASFKSRALIDRLARTVSRLEVALCFGGCVGLFALQAGSIISWTANHLLHGAVGLAYAVVLLAGLVAGLVAWFSLPPRLDGLRPFALLGSSLVCLLIGLLTGALLGALVMLAIFLGMAAVPVLMVVGLLQLLLLVGFSHLCLRFIYRPQPA